MMDVSIVIPTHNRQAILEKCLTSLFDQTYPQESYEIIVIDDGSSDGTEDALRSMIPRSPCRLLYRRQERKGPAAARNLGIMDATGNVVILLGDDIVADRELIAEHMAYQDRHGRRVAVLGYTIWPPQMRITPFMRYVGESGAQFGYSLIENEDNLPCTFFYSSNLSVSRKALLDGGLFDESFRSAAFEDTELGFRLQNMGLKLAYNERAIGYHYHPTSPRVFYRRQFTAGISAAALVSKHPDVKEAVLGSLQTERSLVGLWWSMIIPSVALVVSLLDMFGFRFAEGIYGRILGYYFWRGYRKGSLDMRQGRIMRISRDSHQAK